MTAKRLLLQMAQFHAFDLQVGREPRSKLDNAVIQIWYARLERNGHRHLVGEHEQLLGKRRLQVEVHHLVEQFIAFALAKETGIVVWHAGSSRCKLAREGVVEKQC